MVYPTGLPADAASVAVFEEGMSPEYDITWSFIYELANPTSGDEIGFCMFLQDATKPLSGGGVGPDLGYTGTSDLTTKAEELNGKVIGIGIDSLGAFGLPIDDYGSGDTRDGLSAVELNSAHVRDANGSIVSTESVTAYNLIDAGKRTVRARLGNYGRTITLDYKKEGEEFFTTILKQDVNVNFTSSSRFRPGVSIVKPISSSSVTSDVVVTGFHVEGNQNDITEESFDFTPLIPFTNNTTTLGPIPQEPPTEESRPRLPFLGMEPHVGCIAEVCDLPVSGTSVSNGYFPNTFLYGMSAFIGDVDITWSTTTFPVRILFNYDNSTKIDTGFIGNAAYNHGGYLRQTFIESITSAQVYNTLPNTSDNAPDGFPYVSTTLASSGTFYKDTDTSRMEVNVYSPLSSTDWQVTVGCPFYTLSCGIEDSYLCGLTQQYESLRRIVFTNLDELN